MVTMSGHDLIHESPDLMLEYIESKIINSVDVVSMPHKD